MTARRKRQQRNAIEVSPNSCVHCGQLLTMAFDFDPGVRVVDIGRVEAGWIARGKMQPVFCSACGHVYTHLVRYIPIECATIPCPSCGPGSKLATEILSIDKTGPEYSFVAQLKCEACSKRSFFSRLLGGLSKITKVKVGPTGVEVELTS